MDTEDVLGQEMNAWSKEQLDGMMAVYAATLDMHVSKFPTQLGYRKTLRDLVARALQDYDNVMSAGYNSSDTRELLLANAQVARRRFGHWATRCLS